MAAYSALSVFWLYPLMFVIEAATLVLLYRAVRPGAVAKSEEPKYRMMEDDLPPEEGEADEQ